MDIFNIISNNHIIHQHHNQQEKKERKRFKTSIASVFAVTVGIDEDGFQGMLGMVC